MLKKIVIVGLLAIVIALGVALFSINSIVKNGIEHFGSQILKTPVTVGGVNLSPFSGQGSINELQVQNPQGFSDAKIFVLRNISIAFDSASLFSDTVKIKSIVINEPQILYELSPFGITNVSALLNATNTSSKQDVLNVSSGEVAKNNEPRKVIIDHVQINGGQIGLAASAAEQSASATIKLPTIELKDMGKEKEGIYFSQALKDILQAVWSSVSKLNITQLLNASKGDATKTIEEGVKSLTDGIKSLF